jgi:hypothetical protein
LVVGKANKGGKEQTEGKKMAVGVHFVLTAFNFFGRRSGWVAKSMDFCIEFEEVVSHDTQQYLKYDAQKQNTHKGGHFVFQKCLLDLTLSKRSSNYINNCFGGFYQCCLVLNFERNFWS